MRVLEFFLGVFTLTESPGAQKVSPVIRTIRMSAAVFIGFLSIKPVTKFYLVAPAFNLLLVVVALKTETIFYI